MSTPRKKASPLARRIPLGQLIIEREGALSIECTSLRRTIAAQQKQLDELRTKLRASLAREAALNRRAKTHTATPTPPQPQETEPTCSS